jgi:hypothetical protein
MARNPPRYDPGSTGVAAATVMAELASAPCSVVAGLVADRVVTAMTATSKVANADDDTALAGRDVGPILTSGFSRRHTRFATSTLALWLIPPLCVMCLMWPALWNGYPIVFADTGTYLSQAMHRYLGWDRPVFYSLFIFPLHLGVTTWPVIVVQSSLTVLVLDLTRRAFEVSAWWLLALIGFLSVATWLPWTVSELMPDLFTPLLVLLLSVLVFSASRLRAWQRVAITALAAFMIATQQSSVPLALALLVVFIASRWITRRSWKAVSRSSRNRTVARYGPGSLLNALAPLLAPGLAVAALVSVNAVGFGRVALSPYGNVFVLARVIYDGSGMAVLRHDCPDSGWRLCPYLDRFPPTTDEFLWDKTSPIMLAGGHKAVSADADAIIRAAVTADPGHLVAAAWDNTIEQLTRFESGDGLQSWDGPAGSWIDQDFPARERSSFHAARQQRGVLLVPPALAITHRVTALAGIAAALVLLPIAWRRRHVAAWFLAAALLALPLSAAITGGLSSPHDRYQSRIVWLPAAMAFLSAPALRRGRRRGAHERRPPIPTTGQSPMSRPE